MPATSDSTPPGATRRRGLDIVLWVVQVLLAINFAFSGISKLVGSEPMVAMFTDIGAGQWFRYVVGILEVAGAIGLLIPRLAGLAAVGLALIMVGAIATHLFLIGGNPLSPIVLLLVAAVVAWGRRDRTAALLRRSS